MQKRHVLRKASGLVMGSSMLLLSMMPAASAFAATAPTLSLVAGQGISAQVGSNLTYTATVSGLANAEYQFWVEEPNGQWVVGQNYSTNNTFTLSNVQQGNYLVEAYAMTPSEIKAGDWSSAVASNNGESLGAFVGSTVTTNVVVSGTTTPATDVQPGTNITATASSTGVYDAMYQFWVKYPDGTWTQSGPYTTSDTYTFTAPVAGNYEVVAYAKSPQGLSDPAAALMSNEAMPAAYGSAASVKLAAASSSLVADGAATDTLTATVVDSNGNTVANYDGTVTVTGTSGVVTAGSTAGYITLASGAQLSGGTVTLASGTYTETFTVTNGKSAMTLTAPGASAVGTSDSITVNFTNAAGTATTAITSVAYEAQQATAIKLSPATTSLSVNNAASDQVTIQVLDQAGVAMATGTYAVNVSLTGPGTLDNGTTSETYVFNGNGTTTNTGTVATVSNEIGQGGTIGVTASGSGLTAATVNIPAVVTGAPAKIVVTPTTTSFTADAAFAGDTSTNPVDSYTVTVEDANGNPVAWSGTIDITEMMGGVASTDLGVPSSVTFSKQASQTVNVVGNTTKIDNAAGAYVFSFTDAAGTLTSATSTLTETAGAAAAATLVTGAAINLPETNTTGTYTVQLTDAEGNPVAMSGVPVTIGLYDASGVNAGTATIGSNTTAATKSTTSTAPVTTTVDTNAQGQATVNIKAGADTGDIWNVAVTSVNGTAVTDLAPAAYTLTSPSTTGAGVSVVLEDNQSNPKSVDDTSKLYAVAGDAVSTTFSATNVYGNAYTSTDTYTATLSNANALTGTSNGTVNSNGSETFKGTLSTLTTDFASAKAGIAGTYTLSVVDNSTQLSGDSGSASMTNVVGSEVGAGLFYNGSVISDTNQVSATANQAVELWVKAVDAGGNAVTASSTQTITLVSKTGSFRLTPSGANVTSVTLPAGSTGVYVYYVNGTTGTTYQPSAYAAVPKTVTVGTFAESGAGPYAYTSTVTVTDQNGNPVTGLTAANFTVKDTTTSATLSAGTAAGDFSVAAGATAGTYTLTVYESLSTSTDGISVTASSNGGSATGAGSL